MCDQILVRKDGAEHYCDNVGELRAALGGEVVVDNRMLADDDWCLCSLDWPATAELHGMTARQATMEEGFPWPTFIIEPAPPPAPEGDEYMEVFAFQWCGCVFESAMETVSLHATKAGAYRAMRERLTELAERERSDAIQYGRIVGKGHKLFKHQAWRVRRMEVQP